MSRFSSWSLVSVLAVTALGCGGSPKPVAQLSSSEGAIRGAQEAGAAEVPDATLHVKLAQEQREDALKLISAGENHRAQMMLARAEADAELAIALARSANASAEAQKAAEAVQELQRKAAQ
jgi:hypothetical protein